MAGSLKRTTPGAACAAGLVATLVFATGCSQEGGGGTSAADLTSRLPSSGGTIHYVDLVGLKVAFGVDLGADPLEAGRDDFGYYGLVGEALPLLTRRFDPDLNAALDLDDVTEAAGISDGLVSVIKTDGDLDQIATQLREIGFEGEGETLIREQGDRSAAVRLVDDLLYLAPSARRLESAPAEPDQPPAPVIAELEGLAITVVATGEDCVVSTSAVTTADGEGEVVFEIEGEGSANGPQGDDPSGEITIGEPVVDDSLVIVPMSGGDVQSAPAPVALENDYLAYDCEA